MTLDQKALEAASKTFAGIEGFQDAGYWDAALSGAIEAYLAASRPSAIVEEPMAVAWIDEEELARIQAVNTRTLCELGRLKSFIHGFRSTPLYASPQPHTGRAGVTEALHKFDVAAYVADYEFRGDGGDYAPTDAERELLTDACEGLVAEIEAALNAALTVEPEAPTREAVIEECARIAAANANWKGSGSAGAEYVAVTTAANIAAAIRSLAKVAP